MNLDEFKQLYDECGDVVAKLRVSELNAALADIASQFPQALPLMSLSPYVWANLMIKHPSLCQYYDLNRLDGSCWAWLLSGNLSLMDKCPWEKLAGADWYFLLVNQPSTAHFFNNLDSERKEALIQETKFISEVLVEQ